MFLKNKKEDKMKKKKENKTEFIEIRATKTLKKWLKENNLSPTKIFNNALKSLGWIEDKK